MIIDQLKLDMTAARKGIDTVAKNLLVTLYSETLMVGKNVRNGLTSDEEAISTIKKFAANIGETISLLKARNQDTVSQEHELEILTSYLPQQMTREELTSFVKVALIESGLTGPKAMGPIMAKLKAQFAGKYDGKMASEVVKEVIN